MAGYYDPNKDYSTELKRTDLTASERAQLTQERQNKIDAVYGGNEPTMDGSDKTFSSVYGADGSGKSSASSGFQGSATGVNTYTSDQDAIKDQMNQNSIKWHSATEAEQEQLHAANEALARLLGGDVSFDDASGSWSGSAQMPTTGFSYESAPSYTSRYDSQISDLAESILNRDPFSYSYAEDPLYQYYANLYQRNGEIAMKDTLGEMAARTGGLASSYAGSAAQGSYNNYMQGLNDVIPELYQLAYSMYQDEGDTERANLEMLQALESGDYAKYLDLLQQYNTDRSFDYGVYSDDRAYDYQTLRDAISDAQWQQSYDLSGQKTGASSGTSGVSGTIDTGEPEEDDDTDSNVYSRMYNAGVRTYDDAYAWLREAGYGTTDANRYANGLVNKIEAGDFDSDTGENGYNSAYFTAAMNSLSTMLAQGNTEGAISGIDSFWGELSAVQKQQVQELLARYGYSYEEG